MDEARRRAAMCGYEVPGRPWPEIAAFYRSIVEGGGEWLRPMLALVERIAGSPHARSLFATTSMHTLLIAGTAPFHTGCEVLRVDWDAQRDEFALEYVERPDVSRAGESGFGRKERSARWSTWRR